MSNKVDYSIMSDEKCGKKICTKLIKKNVADRKVIRPLACYKCHIGSRQNNG